MSDLINTVNDRNEETLPTQFLTIPDSLDHINRNQESWYLGYFNQNSIPSQHIELDQSWTIDKLASFHFKKIELEYEYDPDPQLCDSIYWIYVDSGIFTQFGPISWANIYSRTHKSEIETPNLDSFISLIGKECEF